MYDNKIVLTFAKGNFIDSQNKLKNHLDRIGINKQINLTQDDLPKSFLEEHKEILLYKRGYGYCIWKPFIILNELNKIGKEDILLYVDSTDLPLKPFFDSIVEHFKNNDYFFVNRGYNHGQWTKRDTFVLMECDSPEYHNSVQLEAGVVGLKNNDFNVKFVEEWYEFTKNKNILTEIQNVSGLPNINNFKEHRYDQSILTNLFIKNKLKSINFGTDKIKYNYFQPSIY